MKKQTHFFKDAILLLSIVAFISLIVFVIYKTITSEQKIFTIGILALFCGVLFENFRISEKWVDIIVVFIFSFLFSFATFLPGKRESFYIFENHLHAWPYVFLTLFILFSTIFNYDKVIIKLGEGATLLQSLAIIYWVLDTGIFGIDNIICKSFTIFTFIFSLFAIFNSLTYFILTNPFRLILSIWSSIIMLILTIDNAIKVFYIQDVEATKYLSQGLLITLQYFLLGISSIYIFQNIIMLLSYFPSKGSKSYISDIKEANSMHLSRYSDRQVNAVHAFVCIILVASIYFINYKYHFLPRNVLIWLVFLLFPVFMHLIGFQKQYNRYKIK